MHALLALTSCQIYFDSSENINEKHCGHFHREFMTRNAVYRHYAEYIESIMIVRKSLKYEYCQAAHGIFRGLPSLLKGFECQLQNNLFMLL